MKLEEIRQSQKKIKNKQSKMMELCQRMEKERKKDYKALMELVGREEGSEEDGSQKDAPGESEAEISE